MIVNLWYNTVGERGRETVLRSKELTESAFRCTKQFQFRWNGQKKLLVCCVCFVFLLFTRVKTILNMSPFHPFVIPQMYLVIFPEGTRYNPELKNVITDSQAFATKEGTGMIAAVFCCTASYKFSTAHSVCKAADLALLRGLWSLCKPLQVFPINDFC